MTTIEAKQAPADLPDLATRPQVAKYTQTSVATLARWAGEEGKGPKVTKLGRLVRYKREDVLAWIEEASEVSA